MSNDNPYAGYIMQGKKLVREEDVREAFGEVLNNLDDDLTLDLGVGEEGAKSYEDVYKAIKKYTYKVLVSKYKKYGGKDGR